MTQNIITYKTEDILCERIRITGSRPVVFWITGLSGAGKSTIASLFEKKMVENRHLSYMIDGDTVRSELCAELGFSAEDKRENLCRIAHLAAVVASSAQVVVVCTISPNKEIRRAAREIIEKDADFYEVYVKADVELCAAHDPNGFYAPYEIPDSPDIVLDTAFYSAEEAAEILYSKAIHVIYKPEKLVSDMIIGAIVASGKIMEIYSKNFEIEIKSDKSPVTTADKESDEFLRGYFQKIYPEYSILSEESEDDRTRLDSSAGVFIIDPLDGTKEFINHNGEFCVSIGFAVNHKIMAGVIAVPVKRLIYYAVEGLGAYKTTFDDAEKAFVFGLGKRLHVSDRTNGLIMVASRSHMDSDTEMLIQKNKDRIAQFLTVGSCLKGCMIAEGLADIHYRYGGFMKEWDTAAMQIICEESGAIFANRDGSVIRANREDPYNRHGFMILNRWESRLEE